MYIKFKKRNTNKILILSIILFFLFLISLFKNISYPLFWADESMTAMGSERVLEFGYPKVHDGKNVFYDLRNSNSQLGINEKDDAYIGGAGWGQYYFGTIGYKIVSQTNDIYLKTGIYRITFASVGLLGLILIGFFISRFFPDKFIKYVFISVYIFMELISISLVLSLREVRYYSLVIFLTCLIIGLYTNFRFYKRFNIILFIASESISLFLLFITFSPVYFITVLVLGISELIIIISQFKKLKTIKETFPVYLSLFISLVSIIPFLHYFKTFEIAKVINEYYGYNFKMYCYNLNTAFNYFFHFDFILLALVFKVFLIILFKKLIKLNPVIFKISNLLTLYFIISIFCIAKIPNFIFTRYIIYLQPFLSIIIILDFFTIIKLISIKEFIQLNFKVFIISLIFFSLVLNSLINNYIYFKGHIYEICNQNKGPLDFTIPYIKNLYPKTDTLIIAANYEETSYMYYLKCKVIVGLLGYNLKDDSMLSPHIIAYRKHWKDLSFVFKEYCMKARYDGLRFPIKDIPVNNSPELNCSDTSLNHSFKIISPKIYKDATTLLIRNNMK